jgi:hypothetical protein
MPFVLICESEVMRERQSKTKYSDCFSVKRKGAQAQNGINGGVARREDPVYAGFELELAGAER